MRIGWIMVLAILACAAGAGRCGVAQPNQATIEDIFGRDVAAQGLTLVDWDGYMADPAIEFFLTPPGEAVLPVKVTLAAREPSLYFDLPSEAGPQGPRKELTFTVGERLAAHVSIFPARQKRNFETALQIQFVDSRDRRWGVALPIHVIAQASQDASPTFPITVDFSQDKTGFFKDPAHRAVVEQAARDWAFFFNDMHLERVPAGKEPTWIFDPDGFKKSHLVLNRAAYGGYLLYAYGIHGPEVRSGGEPSGAGGFQKHGDDELPIRRSGGLEVEIRGNYNTRGWLPPLADDEWWKGTNYAGEPCDFYSVVHHEIGHALIFNPANRSFPRAGTLKNDDLRSYLGADPKFDIHDHFDHVVDPQSLHGGFGCEFLGKVPLGRWLITKLDLLAAQAIGYQLRPVGPFAPLVVRTDHLPGAQRSRRYKADLKADGGIPFYDWTIAQGELPPGLSLNRFTGEISGEPERVGTFDFTVRIRDYQETAPGVTRRFSLSVGRS